MPRALLPGLALCLGAGGCAMLVHALVSALSPLLVAILLGVLVTNVTRLPDVTAPGIAVAAKRILRIGIVLLGLQVALADILGLGAGLLVVVVAVVFGGIAAGLGWGRLLGLPTNRSLLIACGSSICGAAAVAAVDSVIEADEEDAAAAVGMVVLFGTLLIPLAPLLGSLLGLDLDGRAGLAGASIHEVAQVVAAGGVIGSGALAIAVLVKLARVLMLAPVMAAIGAYQRRRGSAAGAAGAPLIPLFVLGFVAAVALRSALDLPAETLSVAANAQSFLLASAMFALGLGVRIDAIRQLGPRTLALGALSTLSVVTIASAGLLLAS